MIIYLYIYIFIYLYIYIFIYLYIYIFIYLYIYIFKYLYIYIFTYYIRMWLLVRETNGESFRRQWSLPWCSLMYQFIKLGHLCVRQCVSNYIRCARNMSNNGSIVIVCRRKNKQRESAIRLGQWDEPCCHKSTTVWLS